MSKNVTPIDISHFPDLIRLAEEVKTTRKPRILKKNSEDIAVLMPIKKSGEAKKKRGKTKADYEAFKSAAGSLKGFLDAEKLTRDVYESRKLITRPQVKL